MRNRMLALVAIVAAFALAAHGQSYTESTFHTFTTANPVGTLTIDKSGNLYGALDMAFSCAPGKTGVNCGTIFKLSSGGKETVLHHFSSLANGASPIAPVTLDSAGNVYGVTQQGGNTSSTFPNGVGTVFHVTPQGKFSILHKFVASGAQGVQPRAPLTIDAAGNLYGTASEGGIVSSSCPNGCGVVFKITPKGAFSVLHSFTEADGFTPGGNLILDSAGNIYGTTEFGGPNGGFNPSDGALFKLTPKGKYSVISSGDWGDCFNNCYTSYIVRDAQGNFFGEGFSVNSGGDNNGGLYEVNASGTASEIANFCFGVDTPCPDGALPAGQIVESAGLLYGTTEVGGGPTQQDFGQGIVYQVDPTTGIETVLYSFPTQSGGPCSPQGISIDSKGNLYGTATYCYGITGGIVFKLTKN